MFSSIKLRNSLFSPQKIKIDIAIISAMAEELDFFKRYFSTCHTQISTIGDFDFTIVDYKNSKILITHTGLGTTFAASITTLIYTYFSPEYTFFCGTAGGIKSELKICDVVIAERVFEAEIQDVFTLIPGTPFESCLIHPLKKQIFPSLYSADPELLDLAVNVTSEAHIHKGTVVTSNSFPAPRELFEKIKHSNSLSIDMETSAFYQTAWLLNMRVLAVRGISNLLNHEGRDDFIQESNIEGSTKAAATVVLNTIEALLLKFQIINICETKSDESEEETAFSIINKYNLKPHPEGGYFIQTFKSDGLMKSTDKVKYNDECRHAGTAIYYLLKGQDFSAWHRLKSDEIWHYYKGSAVKIYLINKDGELITHLLGETVKQSQALFQIIIPAGCWFAAELEDKTSYCLMGCTVNPGFDFKDFELGDPNGLAQQFPQYEHILYRLTRDEEEVSRHLTL